MGLLSWLFRKGGEQKRGATEGEGLVPPRKDPFPDRQLIEQITIIDIRSPEEIEEYGRFEGAIEIPYGPMFRSQLLLLDRGKKYGILDLRGVHSREATQLARQLGLDVVELKGGFFYLTEVLNYRPKKGDR